MALLHLDECRYCLPVFFVRCLCNAILLHLGGEDFQSPSDAACCDALRSRGHAGCPEDLKADRRRGTQVASTGKRDQFIHTRRIKDPVEDESIFWFIYARATRKASGIAIKYKEDLEQ
jgi:hypothetical protein